jgi:tetratricopeptide (TPR) repeat protein
MSTQRLLISILVLAVAGASLSAQSIPESCEVRDWFQLRGKVAQGSSSLLCKGAMNAPFEYRREAERELKEVIREAPRSDDAYVAHWLLAMLYFRHGQYRKALSQVDQGILERPEAEDLKAIRSMLGELAQFPDLRIAHSAPSLVQGEIIDEDVFAPSTI